VNWAGIAGLPNNMTRRRAPQLDVARGTGSDVTPKLTQELWLKFRDPPFFNTDTIAGINRLRLSCASSLRIQPRKQIFQRMRRKAQ
jgi:hypothetical protein